MTPQEADDLVARVHAALADPGRPAIRPILGSTPGAEVAALVRRAAPLAPVSAVDHMTQRVLHRLSGLGPLEPVLAEPGVTDVLVTADGVVWAERQGVLRRTDTTLSRPVLDDLIERMVAAVGRRVDRSHPTVDARLVDGSRVHVAIPPVAVDGPVVTIRRFQDQRWELEQFAPGPWEDDVRRLVHDRRNIVICGPTGAGKTSLLNALAAEIDPTERVVTIEDAAELRLGLPHIVRLETRPAGRDGVEAVTVRDLVRQSMRMRPDRIVIGEVRGAEAFDMVQALLTGHRGCLSTVHADRPESALRRLLALCQMAATALPAASVAEQIGDAVDVVISVRRGIAGRREIASIARVESIPGGWSVERIGAGGPS